MIKECKVLSRNPFLNIIVVDFDGLHIQMTGKIDEDAEMIFVKYEDGVATVVSKKEFDKSLEPKVDKPKKNIKIKSEIDGVENNSEL